MRVFDWEVEGSFDFERERGSSFDFDFWALPKLKAGLRPSPNNKAPRLCLLSESASSFICLTSSSTSGSSRVMVSRSRSFFALLVREYVGKAGEGDARNFLVGWDAGWVRAESSKAEGGRTIRKPPTSSVPFTTRR